MKERKIEIIKISKYDRIWLKELYSRCLRGDQVNAMDLWQDLYTSLPKGYRPELMDKRLISTDAERIKIQGIVALERNKIVLKKIDKVILAGGEIVAKNAATTAIEIPDIAKKINYTMNEVSFYFQLANEYINLYRGATLEEKSNRLIQIRLESEREIFYNYREFTDIERLIVNKENRSKETDLNFFNDSEKQLLNEKVDNFENEIWVLGLGQEVIWTDFYAEIQELKAAFFLSKKNWRQLFIGKFMDMVMSGVISETVSKALVSGLLSGVKKLFIS